MFFHRACKRRVRIRMETELAHKFFEADTFIVSHRSEFFTFLYNIGLVLVPICLFSLLFFCVLSLGRRGAIRLTSIVQCQLYGFSCNHTYVSANRVLLRQARGAWVECHVVVASTEKKTSEPKRYTQTRYWTGCALFSTIIFHTSYGDVRRDRRIDCIHGMARPGYPESRIHTHTRAQHTIYDVRDTAFQGFIYKCSNFRNQNKSVSHDCHFVTNKLNFPINIFRMFFVHWINTRRARWADDNAEAEADTEKHF